MNTHACLKFLKTLAAIFLVLLAGSAFAQEAMVEIGGHKATATGLLAKLKQPDAAGAPATLAAAMTAEGMETDPNFRCEIVPGLVRLCPDTNAGPAAFTAASLQDTIKSLTATGMFEFVEPDYIVTTQQTPTDSAYLDGTLWGIRNTGANGGTAGIDVNATDAWAITPGRREIIVGVIDTGIRYTHQDLKNNMWTNPGEIPGNGIDDDGNGYVDDVFGINAITNSGNPNDDNNHGTHCAGTIAATANDSGPIVGVAYNVRLMALKFLSAGGSGTISNAVKCLNYAVSKGAHITSNSWGGGGFSQAMQDAIVAANNAGSLFVAAAGNSSSNNDSTPNFPSNYNVANVVAVAAIDRNGALAWFSSYGRNTVHVGAPGVAVYSSTAGSDTAYASFSGTSMATPHAAGVAALLKSHAPQLTPVEIRTRLVQTARPLSSLASRTISGGMTDARAALLAGEDGTLDLSLAVESQSLKAGSTAAFYVTVTDGGLITGATVTAALGNEAPVAFLDNGRNPDLAANDGIYSSNLIIPGDQGQSVTLTANAARTGKQPGTASRSFAIIAPPINDSFANRITLAIGTTQTTGTNRNATSQSGEPRNPPVAGGQSVWWEWAAGSTGPATITTSGSTFDTTLAVYSGAGTLASLTLLAANDDSGGLTSSVTFNAIAGTPYYIQVDGFSGSTGDIKLNYPSPGQSSGPPFIATQPSGLVIVEEDAFSLSVAAGGTPPLTYQWRKDGSPISGAIGSSYNVASAVKADEGSYTVIVSNAFGTATSEAAFVAVDPISVRPANDRFANAEPLPGTSGKATGSNIRATGEAGEPNHAGAAAPLESVWWSWTAPVSGTFAIDSYGSSFDTVLAVYTGSAVNALTLVAENDDAGNVQSFVSFPVVAGETYRIAVDGAGSARGTITLNYQLQTSGPGLINDQFANRTVIGGASVTVTGSNIGATAESFEPQHTQASSPTESVWWSWAAPANGIAVIDTQGSDFDTSLAVYTGNAVDALTLVAANEDFGGPRSQVSFTCSAGTSYAIAVDGKGSAQGNITLNLVSGTNAPDIAVEQPAGTNLTDGSATVNFGATLTTRNATRVFTVRNTGQANLTGLGIGIDGPDAAAFSVTAPPSAPLAPGGSTTFTITFAPATGGVKNASLQIFSNDPDENPFDIALTGTGTIVDNAWHTISLGTTRNLWHVFDADGLFVAFTEDYQYYYESSDGLSWGPARPTGLSANSYQKFTGMAYGNGYFMASRDHYNFDWYDGSPNDVWTTIFTKAKGDATFTNRGDMNRTASAIKAPRGSKNISFGGGKFHVLGMAYYKVQGSSSYYLNAEYCGLQQVSDPTTPPGNWGTVSGWPLNPNDFSDSNTLFTGGIYAGDYLFVNRLFAFGSGTPSTGYVYPYRNSSFSTATVPGGVGFQDVAFGAGRYLALVSPASAVGVVSSTDGLSWTTLAEPITTHQNAIGYGAGRFVTVGNAGTAYDYDGTNWQSVATGTSQAIKALAIGADRFVAVGDNGTVIVRSFAPTEAATPTFTPDGGVQVGSSVSVTVSCATAGATIRYTTNGSEPTETSTSVVGGTVTVPIPGTLKAKAWAVGMNPSATKSASYTAAPSVATPTFTPDGGAHVGSSVSVTVTCATAGATIHYTTDNSEPSETSPTVASGSTVVVPIPGTFKAEAWATGMNPSATKSASYTAAPTVATPTFTPDGGTQPGSSVSVTVSCATAGTTIRYTTDNSEPTETSATVASGGSVAVPIPGTLKAKAWTTGMNPSATKSTSYTAAPRPTVTTADAIGNTSSTATLYGTVNPNGAATTAQFEYGLTTAYGSVANVTLFPANGTTMQNVTASISGLQAGQTYYYRLTATNSGGTGTGAEKTFVAGVPYTFTVANGAVTITGYTGAGGVVNIPVTIDGLPVVSIINGAFKSKTSVTSVLIPSSVTGIGGYAFYGCTNLFNITVATDNPAYSSLDGVLFNRAKTTLIRYPEGKTGAYSILSSVTNIGSYSFYGCTSLTEVSIPNTVASIGDEAFNGCTGLTTAVIPNSVTNIGNFAFNGCTSLTAVTLPNSVTNIGFRAFDNCTGMMNITVATDNPAYSSLDGVLFNRAKTTLIQYPAGKSGAYSVPSSVISIGDSAFFGGKGLTSVTIPNSVTNIGNSAFNGCTGLSDIIVASENPVYSSLDGVLFNRNQTTLILFPLGKTGAYSIPSSVTSIGSYAFSRCTGLTSVTIPNSVTNIGSSAFYGCTGLTAVTIPNSVTNIGSSAFSGCTGLTNITVAMENPTFSSLDGVLFNRNQTTLILFPPGKTGAYSIPNTVTSIGSDAFSVCTGLTAVTIPSSVTSIGSYAFWDCTGLTAVTIPNSVTGIGSFAFSGCTNLASASFAGNSPTMGYSVFSSTASGFTVYFTSGSTGFTSPTWKGYPAVSVVVGAAPTVTTNSASAVTSTTATLNGTLNPNGATTTAQFEYGLTTAYGSTASVTLSPADGTTAQTISANISGLQPGQTYHYRLTATNLGGTGTGADMTLVTPQPPPAPSGLEAPRIRLVGGNVELTVGQSVAGWSYQVQQSDTLAAGSWVDVGAERLGDGSPLVITIPRDPGVQRRFYRLAMDP